jgi:hypothetical protein
MCAPLVPVLDRILPGRRFAWTDAAALPLVRFRGLRRIPSPAIAVERIPAS